MPRNISSPMVSPLTGNQIRPGMLAAITFSTGVQYIWSGVGNLVVGGNTYRGVGSFGKISRIEEGVDVQAFGMTVSLGGIDPALLADCLSDIQLGAPATIYFALFDASCNVIGTPYPLFVGVVDRPTITPGLK